MILNSPNNLSDLNTSQWFRVSATNSTNTNYLYTFDVQTISHTGSVIETIGRYKIPNRPSGDCLFTPHKILKSEITYGLTVDTNIIQNQDMSVIYRLRVGEEFNTNITFDSTQDSIGFLELVLTTASNVFSFNIGDIIYINKNNKSVNLEYDGTCSVTATSSTYIRTDKAYSATILANESGTIESITRYTENTGTYSAIPLTRQYDERTTNFGSTYLLRNGSETEGGVLGPGHFLTTCTHGYFTTAKEIYEDQYEMLSAIKKDDVGINQALITYHTATYATIGGDQWTNVIGNDYERFDIPSGTAQIEASFGTISSNIEYYAITIQDDDDQDCSETFYYKINRCAPTDFKRLCYLNNVGGYEFRNFGMKYFESDSISRKQFTKTLDYDYSLGDRGDTIYSVDSERTITINTDWLRDYENLELKALLESTDVYEVDSSGNLYPIIMIDSNIDYKYVRNIEMIQYTFKYKYAYKNNTNSL